MMTKNFDEEDDNIKLDDEEDEKLGFHEVNGEESDSELDEEEDGEDFEDDDDDLAKDDV